MKSKDTVLSPLLPVVTALKKGFFEVFFISIALLALEFSTGLALADTVTIDTPEEENHLHHQMSNSLSEILKLSDLGPIPKTLTLRSGGGSVFFQNRSAESEFSISVLYGRKFAHCATGGMTMSKEGVFSSDQFLAPGEFLVICFPKSGDYPVTVTSRSGKVFKSSIEVK